MNSLASRILIVTASFTFSCHNNNLYDHLACPGCADKSVSSVAPCTNCRIFVSGTTPGDMSGMGGCGGSGGGTAPCGQGATGVARADFICQNDPARPDILRTWKALIAGGVNRVACTNANCASGTAGRIDWVLKPSTSYYRAAGTPLIMTTDANAVFVFGTIGAINNTVAYDVWSGIAFNWLTSANHCSNWSVADATLGLYGTSSLTDQQSLDSGASVACSSFRNLYCVEQ